MRETSTVRRGSYPLLRRRPRRRFRLARLAIRRPSPRTIALGVVALVATGAMLVFALAPKRADPALARQALANSVTTLAAGNLNAARSNAKAAVAADPTSGIAHAVLARADLELGDGLAAEAELRRARDAGLPAGRTHQLLAHARLLQGDADSAIDEAAKALPRYAAYATRIRARALAMQDDVAGAQAALKTLLVRAPRDAAAWTDLGRLQLTIGDVGGAADAAARAVAIDPGSAVALVLQGEVVRGRYGLVAALPWFEAALKRDAYFHPALIEYAATLGDLGRNADMLAATRSALASRPGSPQALYLQAVLAARGGRYDLSRSLLQHAGGALDGMPGALLLDGALDYATGKYEQATAKWRRLVARQPLNVEARVLLGMALLRSGDPRAGLDTLRAVAERSDADTYTLRLVARAFERSGDRAMAARFLDRAASQARAPAAIFANDAAVGALAAGAAQQSTDPTYAIGLIRGFADSGDGSVALSRAQALAASTAGAPAAELAVGDAYAAMRRYREAAVAYARAADLVFDEPTMLRLVDALARAGRGADAATALSLYLSQNPQSLVAQRIAGHWQVAAGQWSPAIETLEGVRRRIGNRDALLLADLAFAYAGDGDGDVARAYGAAAYALAPMTARTADAYGWALHVAGNDDGARQLLKKATILAPADHAIAAHLAQAVAHP